MKLRSSILLLLAAAALFSAFSCQAGPPELEQPHIRGTVKGLSDSTGNPHIAGFLLIEGVPEQDTKYDRALVTITGSTRIYQQSGERLLKAKYHQIRYGSVIEVWFTGPVAESYPVQAEAGFVVILE
jgi:beta-N-acetylhexosaminidase